MGKKKSIGLMVMENLSRYRILISLIVFGFLIYEDWVNKVKPQILIDSNPLGVVAVLLVFAGIFFRSWAAGTIRKTKQLAKTGAYALTRHPLYIGSLLLAIGFSLMLWNNGKFWAVLTIIFVIYIPKILQEEAHLSKLFGEEWKEYCKSTTMFFPIKKPNLRSFWSISQWKYNKEYQAFLVSLTGMVVLGYISLTMH